MAPARDEQTREFHDAALPHADAVFRFAWRLSRDRAVAEDLVQETYLQAWRSFDRFERGSNCRAWLFGILYFVWTHEVRRRGREPVVFDDAAVDVDSRPADVPTPDRLTDSEVLAAFESLPSALQQAVLLADIEGLSYREIAGLAGIPLGTVMSRLNRARRLLRERLASYAREHGVRVGDEEKKRGRVLPIKTASS
jgi:RNA polymerase sigma-70 factor (ECF subfamily)